jgi:hypothetical protein
MVPRIWKNNPRAQELLHLLALKVAEASLDHIEYFPDRANIKGTTVSAPL